MAVLTLAMLADAVYLARLVPAREAAREAERERELVGEIVAHRFDHALDGTPWRNVHNVPAPPERVG